MKMRRNKLKIEVDQLVELVHALIERGIFARIFTERHESVFDHSLWSKTLLEATPQDIADSLYPADGFYVWQQLNSGLIEVVMDEEADEATFDLIEATVKNWPAAEVNHHNPIRKLGVLLAFEYGSWLSGKVRCEPGEFGLLDDYVKAVKYTAMDAQMRESASVMGGWTQQDEAKYQRKVEFVAERTAWFKSRVVLDAVEQFSDIT